MATYPVSVVSLRFWKSYGITMRPYLLFISGIAGMAGFSLFGGTPVRIIAAGTAFFLSYGFGQALTDCFQTDTDSISAPYRPLIRGDISRSQVLSVSLTGLTVCCIILAVLNPQNILLGILCVTGLSTYTFFKRRWWGGPLYNASIVAILPIMGLLGAMGSDASAGHGERYYIIIPLVLSVFFAYSDFVLTGYFKDISADRISGYETFVVKYGWTRSALIGDIFALITIGSSGYSLHHILISADPTVQLFSILVYIVAVGVLVNGHLNIHRIRNEREAHKPIAYIVRGFIIILIAQISALQPKWIPFLVLYWATFELVLKSRPEITQV